MRASVTRRRPYFHAMSSPPPSAAFAADLRARCPDRPALLAMIHVPALPGSPRSALTPRAIARRVEAEAELLLAGGVDGIVLENMHDRPYRRGEADPAVVASLTAAALALRAKAPDLPLGLQVLAGGNRAALAVAHAAALDFIRAEGFVFAHVADEGWMDADAGDLLRYRRAIGADHVAVLADVKKKHAAHAVTADLDLADTARAAAFCGADGIIVTGRHTGLPTDTGDLAAARGAVDLPVFVGSGITADNAAHYAAADAWIVGSWLKEGGNWEAGPDPERVAALARAARSVRREA
jgi:membrane complex biogenesis BtpA family protein